MATQAPQTNARLKQRYLEEIRPALIERFGYSTPMQAPRLLKITLNMGVGDAKQDSKVLDAAREQIIFPEIDYDAIDQVRGLDVAITTSAPTDAEAYALLEAFGMPFSREGNPYAQTPQEAS